MFKVKREIIPLAGASVTLVPKQVISKGSEKPKVHEYL